VLTALQRIVHEMDLVGDLRAALNVVVEHIYQELSIDACGIFLLDEERAEYVLLAAAGISADLIGKLRIKLGEGLIGLVGEREEPINLADACAYSDIVDISDEEYRGFLGVPILYQGHLLGVLTAQQHAKRQFPTETTALLVTLAIQLAKDIAGGCSKGGLQAAVKTRGRKLKELNGIPGAAGVAIGKAVMFFPPADLNAVPERATTQVKKERDLFEAALAAAREEVHQLHLRAQTLLSVAEQALFDAYMRILDSRSLMNEVVKEIEDGQWAQGALKRVIKRHIMHFEAFEDAYLRERAADFRDLGRRILAHLQIRKRHSPDYPKKTILISEEVTATSIMEVPRDRLVGIVSASGSANSHVAILARSLGIPTVMGLTGVVMDQLSGKELIVDGYNGQVYVSPVPALKKEFQTLMLEEKQLDAELAELQNLPAKTQDGHSVALWINIGLALEGELSALHAGAEGVGLYRTELAFMMRDRFPSEKEQLLQYQQLLAAFAPRPVVMRTLDIGGDKKLPYFPVEEPNPFLGWRGIRVSLDHPEIFLQQIRAMLGASAGLNNLSIMLPMITSVSEIEQSLCLMKQGYHELIDEYPQLKMPKIGLMIEVPAAVYQSYEMAKRVDFLSVGSNDLIQYLLAVDRNNPHVAGTYTGFHPAVLRALAQAVKGSHKAKKPISICGELASDPLMVILLLAMGFDALSINPRSILRVKWVIRKFTLERARSILKQVLKMDDPIEIRNHMEMIVEEHGLAGLIRAGKF
jgi:phosphotransferase system, enzyme I, PtsP